VETRRAAIRYRAGRHAEAHAMLQRLLDRKDPPPRALLLRGRFLLGEGKADEAAKVLTRAVQADPASAGAAYALGLAHLGRRDLEAAESAFESATRVNPRAVAARLHLASIALERGRSRRAARLAREAADGQVDDLEVQAVAARTLRAAGDDEGAEAVLATAIGRHPSAAVLWVERGALLLDRRDLPGARAAFTRAATLAPGTYEPVAGLTNVDVAAGQAQAARARLAPYVKASAPDPRLLALAGQVAAIAGDPTTAETLLKRAVAAAPDLLDAYAQLGRVYVSTGRLDEARAEFARLEKTQPVVAHTMAGLIAESQGRPLEARAAYERALAADPQAPVAANNLAWLLVDAGGDLERARTLASAAHRRMPDRPEMNDTLGWVLHLAGDHGRALTYLQRAVRLDPRNALYHSHLGITLEAQGDVRNARASLERALTIDGRFRGNEQARKALSTLAHQ
jgi:tetratricopeptide (TPR) repeat protein